MGRKISWALERNLSLVVKRQVQFADQDAGNGGGGERVLEFRAHSVEHT
jgi:hypothetical protein